MTHIAIQEKLNGKVVEWREHLSDKQCLSGESRRADGLTRWFSDKWTDGLQDAFGDVVSGHRSTTFRN
jgi:hypothetical protein